MKTENLEKISTHIIDTSNNFRIINVSKFLYSPSGKLISVKVNNEFNQYEIEKIEDLIENLYMNRNIYVSKLKN